MLNDRGDRQPDPATATSTIPDLGSVAEAFVAQWLLQQRWQILHRRWHCRWGELDLIACPPAPIAALTDAPSAAQSLVFIEVKARSSGNWDENGLLALTPQKQAKLWKTATIFLARHPHLADLPCQFDVALVHSRILPAAPQRLPPHRPPNESPLLSGQKKRLPTPPSMPLIQPGIAVAIAGYQLTLQHYIANAFVGEN